MPETLTIEDFRKLSLKPGDVLVLKVEAKLRPEQAEGIRLNLEFVLSQIGIKIPALVADHGTSVEQMPFEKLQDLYFRARELREKS